MVCGHAIRDLLRSDLVAALKEIRGVKAAQYDALAFAAVRELIEQELAVVWHEVEAKLAERHHAGAPRGINPHHLTNARRRLLAENSILEDIAKTHGNQVVTVYVPADQHKRRDAIRTASRRKRALEARYLGWAQATAHHPNLIGDGGERVTHECLRKTDVGYGLINPTRGEVASLFGNPVPGGSLDNAARIAIETKGDLFAALVLVEVKNKRGWFYPAAADLYQLLFKAASLQQQYPKLHFIPVFVARRVHYLTFRMAKHLGFFVIQFDRGDQPILPHRTVTREEVEEMRAELGYVLALTDQAMPGVTRRFNETIPKEGPAIAQRWALMAAALLPHFGALRNPTMSAADRDAELQRLFLDASKIMKPENNWRSE